MYTGSANLEISESLVNGDKKTKKDKKKKKVIKRKY